VIFGQKKAVARILNTVAGPAPGFSAGSKTELNVGVSRACDIVHEIGGLGFDAQINRDVFVPGGSDENNVGAGCRMGHSRVRCDKYRDQHCSSPNDRSSVRSGLATVDQIRPVALQSQFGDCDAGLGRK
jgi:hypothetical protein